MVISWSISCHFSLGASERVLMPSDAIINYVSQRVYLCRARQAGGQGVLRVRTFLR